MHQPHGAFRDMRTDHCVTADWATHGAGRWNKHQRRSAGEGGSQNDFSQGGFCICTVNKLFIEMKVVSDVQ